MSGFLGRELASNEDTGYKVFVEMVKFTGKVIYEKDSRVYIGKVINDKMNQGLEAVRTRPLRKGDWRVEFWVMSAVWLIGMTGGCNYRQVHG